MKVIYFLYQTILFLPLFLIVTILTALVTILGCALGNSAFWGYYPGRVWSKIVCVLSLVPVEVRGREHIRKDVSYIFVANHQGAFDIFLIYGYLNHNFKWMMKKTLRSLPFVGKACEQAGHIYVDDSGAKGVRKTIEQCESALRNGVSLVVFPEGSRTLTGKMGRFKKGAFQLASEMKLDVVPLTIEGPFKIMKRGTYWIYPHKMVLTIHPPMRIDQDAENGVIELMHRSRAVIAESLGEV